jgi:serine/threonine protein kinase
MSGTDTPAHDSPASRSWSAPTRRDLTGLVVDDFQIQRVLGHGGMGEVYLARQISLDRQVALKVLKPELLSNPTYLARFEKEALSAAKLNHPNVVHIYTLGGFDNLKYIAMEYVPGTNLKDFLVRKGPPDLPLALSIMKQAGNAVAAAGEFGLIHRDLKPENLLLTRKGQVKVADFGLCRAPAGAGATELTQEGVTMGTPMYMSPEQVQGKELDHRSDLYSLGVTFYHMLAGVPPFRAETPLALALKHVRETPVDLSVHRPDLPPDLCRLVMKLIAKDPAERFPSAREMLRELSKLREAVQTATMTTAVTDENLPTVEPAEARTESLFRLGPIRPRLSGLRLDRRQVAVLLLVAAVAGAAWGAWGRAENLLSEGSARPAGPPALWMASWEEVPARTSAPAQYRYAQLWAPDVEREAAWLAVPGRFPGSKEWVGKAYIQLARTLFRHGDAERLEVLASELRTSNGTAAATLARIARAGAAALRGEHDELLAQFDGASFDTRDPALNELSLEIVLFARRGQAATGPLAARLRKLEDQLNLALQIDPLIRMALVPPSR